MTSAEINLRETKAEDLPYVMAEEKKPDNAEFVLVWSQEAHLQAIKDPDQRHILVVSKESGKPVGYILLAGLESTSNAVELRRIVISEKGKGYGRKAIQLTKTYVFETLKAHRLWLDVKVYNTKAQNLYLSEGFQKEGVMRESLYANGQYYDMVLMALLNHN